MTDDGSLMQNKYSLVKGAARRARQLQSGAPPLGVSNSMKACKVAQDEIRVGKVTYSVMDRRRAAAAPAEQEPMAEQPEQGLDGSIS